MIQGNTKQIASNLRLSVGERTEIALNVRTDDGMTNGAGNVVKKIQLIGVIWVQFDHSDVGEKTRHENRNLYLQGIESTWTPMKPIQLNLLQAGTKLHKSKRKFQNLTHTR